MIFLLQGCFIIFARRRNQIRSGTLFRNSRDEATVNLTLSPTYFDE